ncbi:MAG: hypothetical protein ACREMV_12705 [Gemmatimonadales bacterium]
MRRSRRPLALVSLGLAAGGAGVPAAAQDALYQRLTAFSGWELRGYRFDGTLPNEAVTQWSVPAVVVVPVGRRVSLDLTSYFVHSSLETTDTTGGPTDVTGFTDTQLRAVYTLSRDRAAVSLALNLPTGSASLSGNELQVSGAVASNFLSFPVSNFGTGFGVTGGMAYARALGDWNLGLSGSVRYLGSYEPFTGDTAVYEPGLEYRVRAAGDRLLGARSRLLLGLTVSTFSTDQLSGSAVLASGFYEPGTRLIGELAFTRLVGRSTVTFAAWDFFRTAGQSGAGSEPDSKENILNLELRLAHPVGRVELEPMLAYRQWNPADYLGGRLYSAALTLRTALGERFSTGVSGRFDDGWITDRLTGSADVRGFGAAVFLRYQ